MPGRLQKVAGALIVASSFAVPAWSAGVAGRGAVEALAPSPPSFALSGADADARWRLSASASRADWDPTDPSSHRSASRRSLFGESARGSLGADWQGRLAGGRLSTGFAAAGGQALFTPGLPASGSSIATSDAEAERDLAWAGFLQWNAPLGASRWAPAIAFGVRSRGASWDSRAMRRAYGGPRETLARDRLAHDTAGAFAQADFDLPGRLRSSLGARFDGYRVQSGGQTAAARASTWEWTLSGPWLAGVDAHVTLWRNTATSEVLIGGGGVSRLEGPVTRDGLTFGVSHAPWRWLSLDAQATVLRARGAPGGSQPSHYATAGATLRGLQGWTAKLFVSRLGGHDTFDPEAQPVRGSTAVNAQLTRRLSANSRLTFDVFNVFDHAGGPTDYFTASRAWGELEHGDNYLFHPSEPRGFRLRFRATF